MAPGLIVTLDMEGEQKMPCPNRTLRYVLMGAVCLCVVGSPVWGSPSGLNNIPTTDVVPPRTLVLQTWRNLGYNRHPQQFVAFKAGGFKGLEFGVDWKAIDDTHGHAELQVKYAFDIAGDWFKGVVGVANLSDNRQHNGYFFPYVATSVDVKLVRLHFGYAPQPHNEAFFAGIDKTVPFLNRNLQLKADGIQINDKKDVLFSAGFLYDFNPLNEDSEAPRSGAIRFLEAITKNIVLEAWVSMPSTGHQESYTLKFNYVISF